MDVYDVQTIHSGQIVMTTQLSEKTDSTSAQMGCMEVWGGSGPRNYHFERPGIEVWIGSLSANLQCAGGGDLHLISSCASGRITRFLLADICSRGHQFAKVSAELQSIIQRHINRIRQTGCVTELTESLKQATDRGCFVSMMLATYFSSRCQLTLCNAGHPPPLLYRAAKRKWEALKPPRSMSSEDSTDSFLDATEYQELSTGMDYGDMALLYSSSLMECVDERGATLGVRGISDLVESLTTTTTANLPMDLLSSVVANNPTLTDSSDATVVLFRTTAKGVGWRDNLLAPFRLFCRAVDRVSIG